MTKWSAGCDRCRQKKVKCDATRPTCKRCLRAGSQCPGYSRTSFEIKDETARIVQKVREVPHGRDWSLSVFPLPRSNMPECNRSPRRLSPGLDLTLINQAQNNRIFFMQHILNIYMPDEPDITKESRFSYIPAIATIPGSSRALVAARDAFSVAQLGTSHKDPLLLSHARQLYGDALCQIRIALEDKTARSREETLIAITLAGLCEFFTAISCNGHGWTSHIVGASQLMATWGAFPLDTHLTRLVFNNLRNSVILRGLIIRRAVLFDQPVWLERNSHTPSKDIASSLNDIMVHIPALLEHSDQCLLDIDEEAIADTLHGSWSLKRRLKTWYNKLQQVLGHNTYQEVSVTSLSVFSTRICSRMFPLVFSFPSFHMGYQLLMYWLSNLILSDNDLRLVDSCSPSTGRRPKHKRAQLEQERLLYANLICQGIPYCTELPEASVGRIGVLCPLQFCQEFFYREARQAQLSWCNEVFTMITDAGLRPPSIPMTNSGSKLARDR